MKEGHGIGYYPDGSKEYEGNFVHGKLEGHGVLFYEDGTRYEGNWV
jgi:antitoxin component YwqK of YwqJK toxin-antitoxin module